MAKDESRRPTPRTAPPKVEAKAKPSAKPTAAAAPKKAAKPAQAATKRVVLAEPGPARTRKKPPLTPKQAAGLLGRIVIALAALAVAGVIAINVMRMLPVFTITSIDTQATEHLTEADIANLAGVAEGTTLLNIDSEAVVANLKKNPWVMSATVHREFPDKLGIEVQERRVSALVLMSTSSFAWYVGEGNVWLEPATLTLSEGQTAKDAAQAIANERGALLVTDVPATVNPSAGSEVSDEVLLAVGSYLAELPEEISSQVVYFSASSLESISCVLASGIEVSLGSPTHIEQKATVLSQILEQYPGEITYINVRTPENPSYRRIDSSTVQPGSGA